MFLSPNIKKIFSNVKNLANSKNPQNQIFFSLLKTLKNPFSNPFKNPSENPSPKPQ